MKGDIRTKQPRIFSPVLPPDMVFKENACIQTTSVHLLIFFTPSCREIFILYNIFFPVIHVSATKKGAKKLVSDFSAKILDLR